MDTRFWHQKWENNDIAFHESKTNPLMVKYFKALSVAKGSRVFLPLCGKTLDIPWLLSNGYRVAGAELSKIAVEQLFANLEIQPKISGVGQLTHYRAENIDLFVGNIFDLSREILGRVDAIYDRAALVALPEKMRFQYTAHLAEISAYAPQLLICYEYDQNAMEGPPFSVTNDELNQHYSSGYALTLIESTDVSGGLKGKIAAKENVWLLVNK